MIKRDKHAIIQKQIWVGALCYSRSRLPFFHPILTIISMNKSLIPFYDLYDLASNSQNVNVSRQPGNINSITTGFENTR